MKLIPEKHLRHKNATGDRGINSITNQDGRYKLAQAQREPIFSGS